MPGRSSTRCPYRLPLPPHPPSHRLEELADARPQLDEVPVPPVPIAVYEHVLQHHEKSDGALLRAWKRGVHGEDGWSNPSFHFGSPDEDRARTAGLGAWDLPSAPPSRPQ